MATLLLFGPARTAAGTSRVEIQGTTVEEVRREAGALFGDALTSVLASSAVWVNGEPASPGTPVGPGDEVAVVPPVSGG